MLAYAKQVEREGDAPLLVHCGVTGGSCSSNLFGNRLLCLACQKSTQESVAETQLPLVKLCEPNTPIDASSSSTSGLTFTDRRGIVEGVYSCLVTILRVLTKDLKRVGATRRIIKHQFVTSATILKAIYRLMDKRKIKRVAVLNGRYACRKSPIIAANSRQIPFDTLDFNLYGKPMIFRGHTPHDRAAIQHRMLSNPEDDVVANDYFNARQDRTFNKFAAQHRQFTPPEGDRKMDRKVTFFLSSQDECESLGPEWRSVFRDNVDVIHQAATQFPDTLFCVRFHPNQASILSDVEHGFDRLDILRNVKIFGPTDDINSYLLIDWSDIVVTFTSTISVEACWRGVPVIQLGPSFYDQLGISETPASTEEFLGLLAGEIRPKSREATRRFAHYEVKDYDELNDLACENGNMKPIGFRRRLSFAVRPAKQANEIATNGLKQIIRWNLRKRRNAA